MGKHSYTRDIGDGFLEEFEPLRAEISVNSRRSVTFPPGRARLATTPNSTRLSALAATMGDRAGRALGSKNRRRARRHNDIHAKIDQLCCKLGKPVVGCWASAKTAGRKTTSSRQTITKTFRLMHFSLVLLLLTAVCNLLAVI